MSDSEISIEQVEDIEEEEEEIEVQPEPVKTKRKKREMTPERKAILLENLRRGRETAAKNRKKKALVKKIKKEEQDDEIDDVIVKSIEKKKKSKQIFNDYEDLKKRFDILNNEYTEFRGRNDKSIRQPEPIEKVDNNNLEPIMEEPPKVVPRHKVSLWDL